jgi:hypothetical protein
MPAKSLIRNAKLVGETAELGTEITLLVVLLVID